MYIPNSIWIKIYSYDPTYKILFDYVIDEINLRYDDGKWWLKHLGVRITGSRKIVYKNKIIFDKKVLRELYLLDRNTDGTVVLQYFKYQELIDEFVLKYMLLNSTF